MPHGKFRALVHTPSKRGSPDFAGCVPATEAGLAWWVVGADCQRARGRAARGWGIVDTLAVGDCS